ncbi:MAG: N-acetyltransferase [Xanthomonadales bacterium]|nr:hypothetical protein [Xanthomonadales bacterium]MCC6594387.1 N-acetyltransferase [Xanthomonadales bacterium]MCE7932127.1 GNAT family N-acetyltransferase [Xanthomonadales bacterium PRO6]
MSLAPRLEVRHGVTDVDATQWDALIADDQPFLSHAFLSALEQSGSLRCELGWAPMPLLLYQGARLLAAAPGYLKTNSHGEFVFDHAWAQAYARYGLRYYPKLLVGVPYSPVPGPRLLIGAGADAHLRRTQLVLAIERLVEELRLSSAHVNFARESDAAALAHDPWLPRCDHQYHLTRGDWRDFDDYLDALTHKKRKNLRAERRRVTTGGLVIEWRNGTQLREADLDELHALYVQAFDRKRNTPALTRTFFSLLCERLPQRFHAAIALRNRCIVAAAIFLSSSTTLYGRYWGAREELAGMHFELCYYQGIEFLLRSGLTVFEPGAQGEHKIARGFLPVRTRSAHLIVRSDFRRAIRAALDREASDLRAWKRELDRHSPFRRV